MNQQLTFSEIKAIVANGDVLRTADRQKILDHIRSSAGLPLLSPEEIEEKMRDGKKMYWKLSKKERYTLKKSGQQEGIGWWDPKTGTLIPNYSDERGEFLCGLYLIQMEKSAYTHHDCKITDLQVEHVEPNGGDYPWNMLLIKSNVNCKRGNTPLAKFVDARKVELAKGKEANDKKILKSQRDKQIKDTARARISSMNEDELRAHIESGALEGHSKHWNYIYRNVGMSSILKSRPVKTVSGTKRSGGCQGNYVDVLRTCTMEYLYGDKELARQIWDTIVEAGRKYSSGKIDNAQYAKVMYKNIELSNHIYKKYNREKFIANCLKYLP